MFQTSVFLVIVLTFGVSSGTRAQQNSVQTEAAAASAEDINTVRLKASAAAESDASNDIKKLTHFAEGAGIALISGAYVVFAARNTFTQCMGVSVGVGLLGRIIGPYNLPTPDPGKLIGKSPEYVAFYTDAYKRKAHALRIKSAIAGAATGCGCLTTCSVASLWALLQMAYHSD